MNAIYFKTTMRTVPTVTNRTHAAQEGAVSVAVRYRLAARLRRAVLGAIRVTAGAHSTIASVDTDKLGVGSAFEMGSHGSTASATDISHGYCGREEKESQISGSIGSATNAWMPMLTTPPP